MDCVGLLSDVEMLPCDTSTQLIFNCLRRIFILWRADQLLGKHLERNNKDSRCYAIGE
jgi:hypothetical protein